ncbi:hypothetical protein Tco_0295341 [Tanacetum coccineum]
MERAATTASSLEAEQDSGNINRTRSMATLNESFPQGTNSGSGLRCQDTILGGVEAQIRFEATSKQSNDLPLSRVNILRSREDSMKLKELMEFCTKLSIKYALTVNPTVYESCIQQFWATAKAKTVNGERQIQALVDKKKVIITEKSVRSDLMLDDAEGTASWNEFSSTMASAIICLATNQNFNFSKYIFDNMMKNLESGVKFLMYPWFVQVFLDKQVEGMSKHKGIYVTPSYTKKIFANMKREGKGFSGRITPLFPTMMVQAPKDMGDDSAAPTDSHSTPIITQPSSSKPQKKKSIRKQRKDSGPTEPNPNKATNEEPISTPTCDLPQSGKDSLQLAELMTLCTKLQKQVLDLEEAKTAQAKEIASLKKRVKKLEQKRSQELQGSRGEEVVAEKEVAEKEVSDADPVTTAGEVVTTASTITIVDELTLAQTLIEIKAAKPKAVTTAATTITTVVASTRPKAKGIVFHDQEKKSLAFTLIVSSSQSSQLLQIKDKGKGKMAEEQEELEKERVAQEKASRTAIIEELDGIQAMIDADEQLAARLQAEEQEQFSIEEKSRMLVEIIAERKKFFAAQRAAEQRSKPPTKNQIRNRMCTYLKNMGVVKSSVTRTKESSKRVGDELESDKPKKQKIDEHVEAEKDDQEEAEMKRHIEIVKYDEVEIDAIPLATKPPVIVEYKIDKDRRMGYFKLIRADGSSKRYSSMIKMLQDIDREDLETLWKLVKAKHENTRPKEDYERVL